MGDVDPLLSQHMRLLYEAISRRRFSLRETILPWVPTREIFDEDYCGVAIDSPSEQDWRSEVEQHEDHGTKLLSFYLRNVERRVGKLRNLKEKIDALHKKAKNQFAKYNGLLWLIRERFMEASDERKKEMVRNNRQLDALFEGVDDDNLNLPVEQNTSFVTEVTMRHSLQVERLGHEAALTLEEHCIEFYWENHPVEEYELEKLEQRHAKLLAKALKEAEADLDRAASHDEVLYKGALGETCLHVGVDPSEAGIWMPDPEGDGKYSVNTYKGTLHAYLSTHGLGESVKRPNGHLVPELEFDLLGSLYSTKAGELSDEFATFVKAKRESKLALAAATLRVACIDAGRRRLELENELKYLVEVGAPEAEVLAAQVKLGNYEAMVSTSLQSAATNARLAAPDYDLLDEEDVEEWLWRAPPRDGIQNQARAMAYDWRTYDSENRVEVQRWWIRYGKKMLWNVTMASLARQRALAYDLVQQDSEEERERLMLQFFLAVGPESFSALNTRGSKGIEEARVRIAVMSAFEEGALTFVDENALADAIANRDAAEEATVSATLALPSLEDAAKVMWARVRDEKARKACLAKALGS